MISNPNQLLGLIPRDKLKKFHQVNSIRGIYSILAEWVLIVGAALLCEHYFSWPLYIVTVIFIGARLLALGLIMHESVHDLISKKSQLNDWLSELFCAWPLMISMRSYRVKHLAHHKWLNTDLDPDYVAKTDPNWQYPMKASRFLKIVLIQLSGFGIFETFQVMSSAQMKAKKAKTPVWYHLFRALYCLTIIGLFVALGKGMILIKYWLIPFATWTQFANRLRRIAEHSGIKGHELPMQTRTTIHHFLTKLLLAPKNIAYHAEHHLYPGVACYYLKDLHQELMSHQLARDNFMISQGYSGVLRDCLITKQS